MPRLGGAFLLLASAHAISPGTPLIELPCRSGPEQSFHISAGDSTVRSADDALCVTWGGGFPALLTMQPCVAGGSVNQTLVYSGADSAFKFPALVSGCEAWNRITAVPQISSYECASIAWNGFFTPLASGAIIANCSAPDTCKSDLCVAMSAPPVCPAVTCASDLDCNLNGACAANGVCDCYKPWGGATCGELKFKPIQAPAPTNGYPGASPNATTWGGNAILFNGVYHLFVAEMVLGCTLAQWGTNSQCVHAIATSAEGPYVKVDVAGACMHASVARARASAPARVCGAPPHPRMPCHAVSSSLAYLSHLRPLVSHSFRPLVAPLPLMLSHPPSLKSALGAIIRKYVRSRPSLISHNR